MINTTLGLNIFLAYSRKDEMLRYRLDVHLAEMKRKKFITTWFDGKINPGEEWEREIFNALATADIILLLISPDFIASDYCYNIEMKEAIERHEKGLAKVIPVILSHCDWEESPFAKIQALPKDAIPILDNRWSNEDQALKSVTVGIKSIINRIIKERESVIQDYYSQIASLRSEIEQFKVKIENLKIEEKQLKNIPQTKFTDEISEKDKLIQKQQITIYELKKQLSQFTQASIDGNPITSIQKAKIINIGETFTSINEADSYKNSWRNETIKKLAGELKWKESGFSPDYGMIGEIVDSFWHSDHNYRVYVLKIEDKYFVPIGENGIELIR